MKYDRNVKKLQIVHKAIDMIFRDYNDGVVRSAEEAEAADYIMSWLQKNLITLTRKVSEQG